MKIKFVLSVYNKLYGLGKLLMIHFCVNLVYFFFFTMVFWFTLLNWEGGGSFCYVIST